jgi:hypothetical protein
MAATDDKREVKRAYGRALKAIDPETDPQSFLDLREAYDAALQWGTRTPYWEDFPEDGGLDETAFDGAAEGADFELGDFEPAGEDWWERWRPEPPKAKDSLGEACARLDALLFDDPPPPPPERILEAGRAVLDHPGLAEVDRLNETELWMAEAISASSPRSDPLIEPALNRFGWKGAERDWRRHYHVASVLDRRDDLLFLKRCWQPGHGHLPALEALSGPPPAKLGLNRLGLAGGVREFMDVVAAHHPTLEQDLDPESLAWWRAYLHGRHLPPNFLAWMLAGSVTVTLAAAVLVALRGWSPWLLLPAVPLAMLVTWAALLGKAELDARARRRAGGLGMAATPPLRFEALMAAAVLLPPLAALLPDGGLWASLSMTASLALAAAGLRLGWVEPEWEMNERVRLFLPVVAGVLGGTMLAQGSPAAAIKLAGPLVALSYLGSRLHSGAQMRALAWPRAGWLALLAGSLVCLLLAGGLVFRAALGEATPMAALLLAPSAIVAGHFAAAASTAEVHYLEWPLRMVAVVIYFLTGTLDDSFWPRLTVAISAYGLLYAASLVISALILERGRTRSEGV